jgi:hypothetical protein
MQGGGGVVHYLLFHSASPDADVRGANFFCLFRVPRELNTTTALNFGSKFLVKVLQGLVTSKKRAKPLDPQSDSMVERYAKTLQEDLQKVISTKPEKPRGEIRRVSYKGNLRPSR